MTRTINEDPRELGERILAVLNELGEDNVFALLNTIGSRTENPREVAAFKAGVLWLVQQGMVNLFMRRLASRARVLDSEETSKLISSLVGWFKFDPIKHLWTLAEGDLRTSELPELGITDRGLDASDVLLNERGYNWWVTKAPRGG